MFSGTIGELNIQRKSKRSALLSGGLWLTIRYFVLTGTGFLLSIAFARLMEPKMYGQYQFILSLLTSFSVFSLAGLNMAAMKAVAQDAFQPVLQAVKISFFSSFLAVPLLIGYGTYVLFQQDRFLGWSVIVASIFFPFLYAPNTWYVFYEGKQMFKPVTLRLILSSMVVTSVLFLGVYFQLNLIWLVFLYGFTTVLFLGIFLWEVYRKIDKKQDNKQWVKLDMGYGLRVSMQKFVYTLSESLPFIFISFFLGYHAVAHFQLANLFLASIAGFIGALATLSLPKLFIEIQSIHRNIFVQAVTIGMLTSIGYFAIVNGIFVFIYGDRYYESYILAKVLVFLPLCISVRTFLVNYFTVQEKNIFIVMTYVFSNIIAVLGFSVVVRHLSFVFSVGFYLYTLNVSLLMPLLMRYFLIALRKTRSI